MFLHSLGNAVMLLMAKFKHMFSKEELDQLRKETKGVSELIHFNNAGSALPPDPVRLATIQYLEEEMTHGGYETKEKYTADFEQAYASIGKFLNAEAREIAIMENATVAWHASFHAIDLKDGDEILISQADYSSYYLSYLHMQREKDIKVRMVPNDEYGQIDVNALDSMIGPRSRVIALGHVPTNSGLVSPAKAVGEVARRHNLIYILDACQSAGQIPLDVKELGCDILSAAGRKYVRGPRGTGFLYVSDRLRDDLIPAVIDLHSAQWTSTNTYQFRNDARKFENWESNYAGIMGLKVAIEYATNVGMDRIWKRTQALGGSLRAAMQAIPGVALHDSGAVKGGIVSFSVAGKSAIEVKAYMRENGVNVSWMDQPSARLELEAKGIDEIVRASVHYYNTEEEISRFAALLEVPKK